MFTGGWVVVSDGIDDWFVSFICKGDTDEWLFSIVSVVVIIEEEEEGSNCLIGSIDKAVVIRSWEGGIIGE